MAHKVDRHRAPIRAAGGLVWRVRRGRVEVALVHRPRYDDWSLPKGKLESGEAELDAAVREVGEELGSRVAVERFLARVRYPVDGVDKQVAFWLMRHVGGQFAANDEVDAVEWLAPGPARDRLSYDVERMVLDDLSAVPPPDSVIVLVRHAKAGKRSQWKGTDAERPLERTGRDQAERLRTFLGHFGPDQVISADRVRCVQTVTPLAESLGRTVLIEPVFSDEAYEASPVDVETALLALAKPGRVSVVCSQGVTIPHLVERLARGVHPSDTRKGAAWVLSLVDGSVVAADYYDDAAR